MDNVLINNIDWTYPKAEGTPQTGTYFIGDPSDPTCVSWCLASHYLIYTPLGNPSRFCDSPFGTSFLATTASKVTSSNEISPLVKAVRDGLGVAESSVVFTVSPSSVRDDARHDTHKTPSLPTTPSSALFFSSQAP